LINKGIFVSFAGWRMFELWEGREGVRFGIEMLREVVVET
jgi:hypothetical protein